MADVDLTLFYRFADTQTLAPWKGLGPTLGIIRTTDATYFDSAGIMQTASSGVARFDHNPVTGESLGLLVEETRTNIALHSGDTSNAAWVASNMTKGSDSVTDPTGTANTKVRLTASSSNGTLLQTVTSASDNYIYDVYMKRVTGTGDVQLTLDNGVTWSTKTLTSDWTRFEVTDASETNPVFGVRIVTDTDAIDFWGSDVNKDKLFITSHIPTVGSSVTRNQDNIFTTDVSWLDAAPTLVGTLYVEASVPTLPSEISLYCQLDDESNTKIQFGLIDTSNKPAIKTIHTAGDNGDAKSASAITANTTFRVAAAYAEDDIALSHDGASVVTDSTADIPQATSVTRLLVGRANGANTQLNGHIRELRYYKVRKDNQFIVDLGAGLIIEHLIARRGGRFLIDADPEIREEKEQELAELIELIKPKLDKSARQSPARGSQQPPGQLMTALQGATSRLTRAQQSRFDRLLQESGITLRELKIITNLEAPNVVVIKIK